MFQNSCQLQEDTEYLGKRSVDGSEAISSQWELELEANLENLNNLSLENSVLDHDSKNESTNLHFYNEENSKSNKFLEKLNYKFSQDKNHSIQNLKQSKNLFKTLKNPFVNKSLMTYFEESSKNTLNDLKLNKHKTNIKDSKSKSLNNSPMKINIFNLSSKFMEKNIHQRIAKYVPNNVFNFGFSNNKSQSNSDLNLSSNLNTSFIEKYQSFDNIIDDKTENFKDNVTNLKYIQSFIVKEVNDNGLNVATKLQNAQLINSNTVNLQLKRDIISKKKWFRSNSIQFLPSNVNSSPIKSAVYLPNEQSLNRNLSCSSKYSISKLSEKQLIINELPLLSLFKKDNLLVNSKSISMINLSEKKNFISWDDIHLNNIKTLSSEMLPNLKDSSFSNFIS